MKSTSEIIKELVVPDKSISSPLLKTKVLANKFDNDDLINWVNKELVGYRVEDNIPDYRVYICNLEGDYINGNMYYKNQTLSTVGLDSKLVEYLSRIEFNQSISSLESMIKECKSEKLIVKLSAEIKNTIANNIRSMGNPYFNLINVHQITTITFVNEIISNVRNKLLDFMLKVENEFGSITKIEDLTNKSKEIQTIMNHTIINNTGDGNVVNTGDESSINVKNSVIKNDKFTLENYLKNVGITDKDCQDLLCVIDTERPNLKSETFGKKVNKWTSNMIGKALDGTWNIGIAVAGGILVEGIKKYYGM